jgi:triosephosphate isomerase
MAAPQRKPLMAGNWKMNLHHLEAIQLVQKLAFALDPADFDAVEVVVLPPFTALRSVQTLVDGDRLLLGYGAQDLSPHQAGAYTGDVGGPMLAKLGCSYVVVGHSERREYHHETDEVVNAKVKAAFANGIVPILCVGEPLEVRQAGSHVEHVLAQLDGGLAGITAEQATNVVVAYEPVWAIGTGEVATPADAQEVCAATPPPSWPSPTSTAASSGERASTPTTSRCWCATGCTPRRSRDRVTGRNGLLARSHDTP